MNLTELEAIENDAPAFCARCGKDITGLPEGTVVFGDGTVAREDDDFQIYCDKLCAYMTGPVQ